MTEDSSKRMKTGKTIGTHNGSFHCDEALACWMLLHTQQFAGSEIIRSRDPAVLDKLDIIVDVGSVYDPSRFRFDHHQPSFKDTFDSAHFTRLSSAGLIYKHFGREIVATLLATTDSAVVERIYQKVYDNFVEAIDGVDNGVDQYPSDLTPKYKSHTSLASRVGSLNPWWNDTTTNIDGKFMEAVELTGKEFSDSVLYYGKCWLPARTIVEAAIATRYNVHPSGEIVLLSQFAPWKEHFFEIEKEMQVTPPVVYILFGESGNKSWRVQCVPKSESSFQNRLDLMWKGLRDEELSKASGIDGGVFVHVSGFIGGNKTYEGALEMAKKSLEQPRN